MHYAVISPPVPRFVTIGDGLRLEYVEQGEPSGLPIVFLHGVTDSWRSFESVLPLLPPRLHAFAVSQRGHGDSSRPHSYRFADLADDVRQFLDALALPAAVIVGHSMGSCVAQLFALEHPERTLAIGLMGSFASLRTNPPVREISQSVSRLRDPVDPAFAREFQESTLARPIAPPSSLDVFVAESLKLPARVWHATFAEFLETDFSSRLREIEAPAMIFWGDRDALCPWSDQAALSRSIPTSRLTIYHGGGHAFHWEDPASFAADLVKFADAVRSGTVRPR
jgi:non-heme chloroperoxidase